MQDLDDSTTHSHWRLLQTKHHLETQPHHGFKDRDQMRIGHHALYKANAEVGMEPHNAPMGSTARSKSQACQIHITIHPTPPSLHLHPKSLSFSLLYACVVARVGNMGNMYCTRVICLTPACPYLSLHWGQHNGCQNGTSHAPCACTDGPPSLVPQFVGTF